MIEILYKDKATGRITQVIETEELILGETYRLTSEGFIRMEEGEEAPRPQFIKISEKVQFRMVVE